MTTTQTSNDHRLPIFRAKVLEQAGDFMEKAHLTAGEVCELYMGAGLEIALAACPTAVVHKILDRLRDNIESGEYLQ